VIFVRRIFNQHARAKCAGLCAIDAASANNGLQADAFQGPPGAPLAPHCALRAAPSTSLKQRQAALARARKWRSGALRVDHLGARNCSPSRAHQRQKGGAKNAADDKNRQPFLRCARAREQRAQRLCST
jgi:hypothetical protein